MYEGYSHPVSIYWGPGSKQEIALVNLAPTAHFVNTYTYRYNDVEYNSRDMSEVALCSQVPQFMDVEVWGSARKKLGHGISTCLKAHTDWESVE
jgi:hypothetical protein